MSSSLPHSEDPSLAKQLRRLEHFNQFIREVTAAVLPGKDFESVWTIANRVYDRHCSSTVRFLARPGMDESRVTALSA
jgi:hypothetical protein